MIKFTLIENSLDSIEWGLVQLKKADEENNPSSFKQSLLSLFQGAELALKEILVLINPITIFDKNSLFHHCQTPLKPKIEELYNCKSLNIRGISIEVKKHYDNIFTNTNIKVFEKLAKERNKIQHFAIEISPEVLTNQLLELYLLIIKPAFKIITEHDYSHPKDGISLYEIKERISNFESSFLSIQIGDGFSQGICPVCNSYNNLFIIYEDESYPFYCYCTACDYELKDIAPESYNICPECDSASLVYDEEYQAGICLWHKCYYCNEGGFVEMLPCDTCSGFEIEGCCPNCSSDEK
jgi:hypothetical protein